MPVRRLVTARHQTAAQLLVDGKPAYTALKLAGYSHWTARKFGYFLRHSWGLREAIRLELKRRRYQMRPAPKGKKYDRRLVALAITNYCVPEDHYATSNLPTIKLHADEMRAERIAAGLPSKAAPPPEKITENLVNCPCCDRRVDRNQLYLNQSQTGYVCLRCAGAWKGNYQ
jgi:hypothetical protein